MNRRTAVVIVALGLIVGGGIVASAATPDTYVPPCTANTDACRQQRIVALENHYKGHSHPTPTPSPTPSVTPTPTPSPSATPTPSVTPSATGTLAGFPDASNTGVPASVTLTAYSGPMTITTAGTVIDGKQINGQLTVNAANVTVRNSRITSTGYYGILLYGANLLVEDTTFNGATGTASIASTAGGQFVARRVNVSGGEDGVRLASNCTLEASYVHDLGSASGGHYDAVTADGYNGVKIIGNTILNQHDQTAAVWIGDPRYGPSDVELRGNLLGGGGYTIYAGPGSSVVADNQFSTRYFARSGYWGPVAYWTSSSGTWSGNTWADGPNVGQSVTP